MKDGDFVTIDYVARVKDSGEIFDLTKEDLAKKEGVYKEKVEYKPVTFIVGANFVIRGLDEALHKMKVGDCKALYFAFEKYGYAAQKAIKQASEVSL